MKSFNLSIERGGRDGGFSGIALLVVHRSKYQAVSQGPQDLHQSKELGADDDNGRAGKWWDGGPPIGGMDMGMAAGSNWEQACSHCGLANLEMCRQMRLHRRWLRRKCHWANRVARLDPWDAHVSSIFVCC